MKESMQKTMEIDVKSPTTIETNVKNQKERGASSPKKDGEVHYALFVNLLGVSPPVTASQKPYGACLSSLPQMKEKLNGQDLIVQFHDAVSLRSNHGQQHAGASAMVI